MADKIQVSTIAKPRDEYTSNFTPNTNEKDEWIPKKPSIFKTLKFEGENELFTDYYKPICKTFTESENFIAPKNGCLAFVLVVGGHGYGSETKEWGEWYNSAWTDPIGGWQMDDNCEYKVSIYNKISRDRLYLHNSINKSSPSSFGVYLSANAGLNIENSATQYQRYREWRMHGWASAMDWGKGQYRHRSETTTHNVVNNYDGILQGNSGEVKFGIFTLAPNEIVTITIGDGVIKGHVDLVYFELVNGKGEAIEKPTQNDVTLDIVLPKPKPTPLPLTPLTPAKKNIKIITTPSEISLAKGLSEAIKIETNAKSYEANIVDSTIAEYDKDKGEIKALNIGTTLLKIIAKEDDTNTLTQGVRIEVLDNIINPTNPTPPNNTTPDTNTPDNNQNTTQKPIMINYKLLDSKIDSMNAEQLAYAYALSLLYVESFKPIENDLNGNMIFQPISAELKEKAQKNYDDFRTKDAKLIVEHAKTINETLAIHIMTYINKRLQGYEEAHIAILEPLIEEYEEEIDGMTYTHRFSSQVVDLDNETYLNKLTLWIKELANMIVRV